MQNGAETLAGKTANQLSCLEAGTGSLGNLRDDDREPRQWDSLQDG